MNDFTATGCNSTIMLTVTPAVPSTSEMGIIFWADDRIEGTEVLTLQLSLTSPTQDTVNNAGNIFFRDTSTIRVIDRTGIAIHLYVWSHYKQPKIYLV